MTGMEIIALLSNSPTAISSVVSSVVVGGLFTTIFLRRNTSVAEFEKIKNGQFKEVADSLLKAGKMTYVEYYQASNFLEVAKKADKYYSEIHHDDNNNVNYDFDWFVRFYEAVGNVSDEAMQELWAKLLAGELAEPSSFSLKTIDVLRNLSKKDAELFSLICSHSVMTRGQNFLPNYDTYLENHNIYYTDIMKLNEQGLIFNDGTIGFSMSISQNRNVLFWNNDLVMTIESSDVKNIEIHIKTYPFTKAGQELAVLVSKSVSEENFIELAKEIANKNQECILGVYKIVSLDEKSILHDGKNLLESISNNED